MFPNQKKKNVDHSMADRKLSLIEYLNSYTYSPFMGQLKCHTNNRNIQQMTIGIEMIHTNNIK